MRAIINISLPQPMVDLIEISVAKGNFASKSEFFRHIIREWQENQLLSDINKSRAEFKVGKGKLLKSLKDLE